MEAYFSKLYRDMRREITNEVPEVNTIEQGYGQEQTDEWKQETTFPAVLIDFPLVEYTVLHGNNIQGKVNVSLRLIENLSAEGYQNEIGFFDLENSITGLFHGWEPTDGYSQALTCKSIQTITDHPYLRIREIKFVTSYQENEEDGLLVQLRDISVNSELQQ